MPTQLQLRRGTEVQHESFTGAPNEPTIDIVNKDLRIHDGTTPGGHSVAQANKYSHLKSLVKAPLKHGAVYYTASLYSGWAALAEAPKSSFYLYNDQISKSEHDGSIVIAPEAIASWDGTHPNISVLLNWTGTGTGAFILLVDNNEVSLLNFGATGLATDNQSISIDAAFKAHNKYGYKITGRKQDTYLIDSNVVTKNIDFDGNGCLFKVDGPVGTSIRSSLGWESTGVVSSDNNLVINTSLASDFSAFSSGDDNQVTLTSVAGIEKGHLISIVTNDAFGPTRFFVYKRGITSVVQKVDSVNNIVYLENTIPFDLTAASSRVVVCVPNRVSFKNARFEGATVEDDQRGLVIDGAISPILENLEFDVFGEASLTTQHCINVQLKNVKTGRSWWADTQATSYGFLAASCNGVYVDGLDTFTGRHGFTTGAYSAGLPIDTSSDSRGNPCMNIVIDNSKIYPELGTTPLGGGNHNGLDTHAGTKDITINNSEIYRFTLNADKVTFNDCTIKGQSASSCFVGMRPIENGETAFEFNHCILDPMVIALRGVDTTDYTDPIGLSYLGFNDCQCNGAVQVKLVAEVDALTANSAIKNFEINNSDNVFILDHDYTNLKVDLLSFKNLKGNRRGRYTLGAAPYGVVGHLHYDNCELQPDFNTLFCQMAESVEIASIRWLPEDNTGVFKAKFSDSSDIFITNTRLNFGTGSTDSVDIVSDSATHGAGTYYSINSPIQINGGAAITSFGFTSVTEL